MSHSIFLMNPIGSVEKTWGSFLNEAYLRRTYLQGRMHVLAETVALYLRGQMLNEAFPANVCGNGCNALQGRLQTFAGTAAMLCV